MAKKQLVLALFENESAADMAVDQIKQWDKASKEIKLGSIGILVKDEKGKVQTQKLGARHTATGVAGGVLAAVLSGGVSLLAGVVVGGITGGFPPAWPDYLMVKLAMTNSATCFPVKN